MANRQWILAHNPEREIGGSELVFKTGAVPKPAPGEVVVKVEYLSLDPTNRIWMNGRQGYMPPVALGEPMRGFVVGLVTESANHAFAPGDWAMGIGTWSDYCRIAPDHLLPVPVIPGVSRKDVFGMLYVVAPTAYFGLTDIGQPKIGETLVVSAAAGAVGSIAGQLGKVWGCRVIGIAGGSEKCRWLTKDLGFDAAIDYKAEKNLDARLAALAPDGVDVFFDNVGGDILDTVMGRMNLYGRVIQCGLVAIYNADKPVPGPFNYPAILLNRLRVQGFIVLDLYHRYSEAYRALGQLYREGKVKWRFHDVDGLENAFDAVTLLYTGGNHGKMIVKVS